MKNLICYMAIAAVLLSGCGKKEAVKQDEVEAAEPAASTAASDSVKHRVMSFDLEGLGDDGSKKWDVKGESAEAVTESRVKLNNITARAFGNEAQATITADKGVYDKTANNVVLEENVKATIENTAKGAGNFINLSGVVAGENKPKDDSASAASKKTKTIIVCDGEVQFDYAKNQAYFNKNVKVTNDEGNIDADKITINLDPVTKKINNIVADGNVKITRGENITYSDKATYIEAEKKIVLTGQPKLVIYQEGAIEENLFGDKK